MQTAAFHGGSPGNQSQGIITVNVGDQYIWPGLPGPMTVTSIGTDSNGNPTMTGTCAANGQSYTLQADVAPRIHRLSPDPQWPAQP
jgi:hypothetical protein